MAEREGRDGMEETGHISSSQRMQSPVVSKVDGPRGLNVLFKAGFLTLGTVTVWAGEISVLGFVLCIVRCLAALLAST